MKKLQAISLFSGCGGFDLGATKAGIEIIWANDIDEDASKAYRSILPNVDFHLGDIQKIGNFPQADILIGCYPCTGFSLGARRRNKNFETRDLYNIKGNFLYTEFLRALKQIKPKYLFVENVRGMLSAEDGWFFNQQLEGFKEAGYTPQYKLLKAEGYGVAQARRRIFIVGVRKDLHDFKYHFPEPTHGLKKEKHFKFLQDLLYSMDRWPEGEYFDGPFHGHYLTRNRKRSWDELSYTIVANSHHVPLHPMGKPMLKVGKDNWKLRGNENRRLSWRECAILQDLPHELLDIDSSLKAKYKVIGNAVPPILGKKLIEPVVKYENS